MEYVPASVAVKKIEIWDPLKDVTGKMSLAESLVTLTEAKQKFCSSSGTPSMLKVFDNSSPAPMTVSDSAKALTSQAASAQVATKLRNNETPRKKERFFCISAR